MAHRRYVLACVVFIFCRVDGESLYGLKGKGVSLKPNIPGQPTDILWKHNGNKLVEFNGNEEQVYGTFQNRITLDWHNAEIVITDLRFEDSGKYDLEVAINNKLHRSSKTLVVIDEVPEPTISCKMNDGSSSNKSGTLECSAESKDSRTQSLMKFQWESRGNVQPGPQLTISLGDEHDDHVYTCNVSNPMSSKTTTFTAKDCYPDESSSGSLTAGIAIAILLIFVVLAIVVLVVFCYKTQKACFAVKGDDEENQPTKSLHETTVQVEESKKPLLNQTAADQPPERTGFTQTERHRDPVAPLFTLDVPVKEKAKKFEEKKDEGKAPPFSPCGALPPEPIKKADERANLQEDKTSESDPDNLSTNGKGEADEDQDREPANKEGPQSDSSDCEKENEPDPADVSADTVSHPEPSSTAPEEPGLETTLSESGSDQTTAQDEENSPPTDEAAASPPPDMTTGRLATTAVEANGDLNKDKDKDREPTKKEDPADEPADLQENKTSQSDPDNLSTNNKDGADEDQAGEPAKKEGRHCDSSDSEKENEPDPPVVSADTVSDPEPSSTAPEEPGLETTLSESELKKNAEKDGETNVPSDSVSPSDEAKENRAPEDTAGKQSKDMNKPVSTPENEAVTEEIDKENDLHGDTSQQPQTTIQNKKTNNEHTNTLHESPDTPHKTPDQEETVKTTQDPDKSREDEDETAPSGQEVKKPDQ